MASLKHNRSENAQRPYEVTRSGCEGTGRTWAWLKCPFCQLETKAYVWSLAGGGRLCQTKSCRAKFTSFGMCYPAEGRE